MEVEFESLKALVQIAQSVPMSATILNDEGDSVSVHKEPIVKLADALKPFSDLINEGT